MERRNFLAAAAAAAAGAKGQDAPPLATAGGTPVRAQPLRSGYWGTQFYDEKERAELLEVLETRRPFRWYGTGAEPPNKTATFEREFAARMQTRFALAITSGTAALQCAVNGLAIGPGDEVILPAWTWHSCYDAIVLAGALPVFAEIDESFNLDPNDLEARITPRTRAVMAVHLQGNPADLDRILPIARKHNLKVIEDCAQSVGASYKGKPLGSHGDVGIYSLQLNKTITAGEGGAMVTSDPVVFERASRFHDIGALRDLHQRQTGKPQLDWFVGCNFRQNEFCAGVLLAQLRKLDTIIAAARANAKRVYDGVRTLPGIAFRRLPDPAGELGVGVFIRFDSRERCERFKTAMRAEGVPVSNPGGSVNLPTLPYVINKATVHPAWPSFTTPHGKAIRYEGSCPRTTDILSRFAGPAIDPKYTRADTDDIIAAIRKVYPVVTRA
jgi:8-amino-3,8-dideoxy-alpha-D-manno-octulosonate transaminase